MGNILRCICGGDDDDHRHQYRYSDFHPPRQFSVDLVNHEVIQATSGLAALADDLLIFEITSQVPEGLSSYVDASEKAQENWYRKLLEAWKGETPVPKTRLAAANLVARALWRNREEDIQGILDYYRLPPPQYEIILQSGVASPPWPKGVQSKFHTLPVEANSVTDGDGITVYENTAADDAPLEVKESAIRWNAARDEKNNKKARTLQLRIKKAGYRAIKERNGKVTLVRKHRIRLRGIDAPEGPQPFGKEAKEGLLKLTEGESLKIHVYNRDRFGRLIGDVYCNDIFVQEQMLRRGLAMHYTIFDKRPEFAKWQREAKAARRGLWALPDPEEPWEWRKRHKGWRGEGVPLQVN